MQKRMNRFFTGLLALSFFAVAGCQQASDSSSSSSTGSTSNTTQQSTTAAVDLNMDFAAVFDQVANSSSAQNKSVRFAAEYLNGTLSLKNTADDSTMDYTFRMSLDKDNSWDAQGLSTLIFSPGNYDFSLSVKDSANHEYRGTANSTIVDGTNDVSMTIRPVIGDTAVDVNVQSVLSDFKIQYPGVELTNVTTPKIGVIVDGGAEQIFDLTTDGGNQSSTLYLRLDPGNRNIKLKLYDDTTQIGKSVAAQEDRVVTTGTNITMDLLPLHGETTFSLTADKGDATFNFTIPAAVINEAGGVANLAVDFTTVGAYNPVRTDRLTLAVDASGDYTATITYPLNYDPSFDTSLLFTDLPNNEEIGNCSQSDININDQTRTLPCDISLRRRALISGNYKAVVALNVMNLDGSSAVGATIKVDDVTVGITGEAGAFGTDGYLKVYLVQGSHKIEAIGADFNGVINKTVAAGKLENFDITLSTPN